MCVCGVCLFGVLLFVCRGLVACARFCGVRGARLFVCLHACALCCACVFLCVCLLCVCMFVCVCVCVLCVCACFV